MNKYSGQKKQFYRPDIQPPSEQQSENNLLAEKKLHFITLLFILIILAITGAARYFGFQNFMFKTNPVNLLFTRPTNTSSSVASNWKIYSNQNIRFKYPPDWIEQPAFDAKYENVTEFRFKDTTVFQLSVLYNNKSTGKYYSTLEEYSGDRIKKATDVQVNGYPAKKIIDPGDAGHVIAFKELILFTPDKDRIANLYFKWPYYTDDCLRATEIFNQLISDFEFLN